MSHSTLLERLEERLVLSAIMVTGTGDTVAADGLVTLREAMLSINSGANVNADVTSVGAYGTNDTISFNIPGVGVQTISPSTPLPTLVKPVSIDGYTQPGTSTNTLINSDNAVLRVQLDGTNAGVGANGLVFGAGSGGSSVKGLVINRFAGTQILVQSSGNTLTGNFIGTDATGNIALSLTSGFGIGIEAGLTNTIGGLTPALRNVIGGNSDGINLGAGSQSNVIQGNFIGVGADGTSLVTNRFHGVALRGNGGAGVQTNQIGGTVAGAGNRIANNGAAGVAVFGSGAVDPQNSGNSILGNSIFNNGLLSPGTRVGIDLVGTGTYPADDGVTSNDSVDGDGDVGPNLLQNYPVLSSVTSDSVSTTLVGTLNSRPNTVYRIEFFSSPTVSGTGHGEGQNYLGFTEVTTNNAGNVRFNTTLMTPVSTGQYISATATSGETTVVPPATSPAGVLGSAASFAVFSSGTLTATTSNIVGDVGLFPAAVYTNSGSTVSGTVHNGDAIAAQADADIATAYTKLGNMAFTTDLTGLDLGGLTLTPGVYKFGAGATLTGTLKLDTQGDQNAVFVFQVGTTLATAAASSIVFMNGATDSVYWQVGAAVGMGATSTFLGNIVAVGAITVGAGANLPYGRVFSRDGAITVSTNLIDTTSALPSFPSTPNNTSEFSVALAVPTVTVAPVITATTFIIVTSTADTVAFDGVVTLREAMLSINSGSNINADVMALGEYGVNDTISFNIPGVGVQTISPSTPLPTLVKPVSIDGYTQPGTSTNTLINSDNAVLRVQLDGTNAGVGANGLVFGAGSGGSSVKGLVINRFAGTQILVQSSGNTLTGNFIGTDATGNTGLSITSGFGIGIEAGLTNIIGGLTPALRNVIGGNSDGINLGAGSQSNVIQGNFIGVGADGTTVVTNRFHGVALRGNGGVGVQNNQIGGTVAGAGNRIANNGAAGVAVFGDGTVNPQNSGNAILGNSIFNNGLLSPGTRVGIDLVGTGTYPADDGVTANDIVDGDGDVGPNLLQNYPVLSSANSDSVSTTLVGTLNSRPNTVYRIEFFSSPTVSGTGHGEGQTYLGFTDVTTNNEGNVSFNTTLMTPVSNGRYISATATSGETTVVPPATSPAGVLGSAASFAVFASGTVTATTSNIVGDVGLSPAAVFTNSGSTVSGTVHNGDAIATQADADIATAYTKLGNMAFTTDLTGLDLGGLTLTPGVYKFGAAATLTGVLKLDTQGDPNAVFVFQVGTTLATAAASSIVFLNGATDSVYWQVGAAVGMGATSTFLGNIVAVGAITVGAGANLPYGRVFSRDGAVTISTNLIDTTSALPSFPSTPNNTSEFSLARLNISSVIAPNVTLTVTPATLAEAAGTATITATLSVVSTEIVTVNLAFSGTATDGIDYTHSLMQIVIPAGSLSGALILTAVSDVSDENNETIIVDVSSVTNGTELIPQQVTTTIIDDDSPPTLSISDFALLEGNAGTTSAVFTVTLSAVSGQTVTVLATSANGTATSGSDYSALAPTTLTFLPGETTKTITVLINGDTNVESNETLFVNLTGATNATIADAQGLATIINDDPVPPTTPTLSISDFAVLEGNSGTTSAVFTVTLSAISAQTVTVVASSANGTADSTSDYAALLPTTITFLPGETTKTITVIVSGDLISEANETLLVNLTGPTNATIADGQGLLTIINDDPVPPASPTISISDFAVLEGDSGTTTAVFTVTLSTVSAQTITVVAASANGTADSASDYAALAPTMLTFLPGETTKTVTVTINGDVLSEANETLFVNLSAPTNATVADSQGLLTIINDDPVAPSSPTLSISDYAVLEGNAGTSNAVFTVTLSAVSAQTVTVFAASANGTADSSSDYAALAPTILTFLPGETTKTITVAINGDTLVEGNETLLVNLTGATNATIADGQGLATIVNDDPVAPTVPTLSISDYAIVEGNSGTSNAVFTVTLSAVSAQTVTVVAASANGTADSGSDYVALAPTTVTFLPGETTKTITVAINGDTLVEGNETLVVNLTGATNATIADGQGLATIINDDPVAPSTPTLSISDYAVLEGNAGTSNAVFTVTLSAVSAQTVTVVVASANGTADSSSDYVALAPTILTFLPGETTKTITVAINGDTLVEGNETLFVNLTGANNATIADGQGLATIINDDPVAPTVPTLSISDYAIVEGNSGTSNAVFTVTLSTVSAQTVTVVAASANGTADSASDYVALGLTTITFLPGEVTKTITVAINGDTLVEGNETLFVNLSGATNATIADGQGLATILNDDPVAPTSPTLSISDFAMLEGNSGTTNATFVVTLSTVSAQTVTVVATSTNGTATAGSDYVALAPTLITFLPGETTKTITVAVNGDLAIELDETLFVNLTGAINATIADGQGLLTIVNDDPVAPATPTLSVSDVSIVEGNSGTSNAVFSVTLSSVSTQTVTVVVASANNTATASSDYVALPPMTLTFLPGETTQTVVVAVNGDLVDELDETFFLNLSGATNATIADSQGVATIVNDDQVAPSSPALSISDYAVVEGNAGTTNAVFTVTLSAVSAQTVTVIATSANGTANSGSDYIALAPLTLTFLPGETTKTVTVVVNGDTTAESNETFVVNLTGATNATIADAQGLATIINDDPVAPSAPSVSISDFAVLEGNTGTVNAVFTVTLSAVSAQTITVVATSANGTADSSSDYAALAPTTITFLPGELTKTITVAVNGDTLTESNETLFVNLTSPLNATIADGQGQATIVNDDAVGPESPTISISDFAVVEGNSGTVSAVFTVTLSAVSSQTVTVVAATANGTADAASDYIALAPTTITFLPGETTKTITVAVNGDVISEANETLFVNLTGATNASVNDGQGVLTIINDDPVLPATPTVSISDFAVLEGNSGTTTAVFTVTLSAVSAQTVTVVASSANGTADSASDYVTLAPTTITFLPGETTKTITVAVNGDTILEVNETLFVNLTSATNATIADGQGLLTILNDDPNPPASPTLSISDFAIMEGNVGTSTAVFTVTLSAASAQTVTVSVASADGDATASSDYLALLPTLVTFAPGVTSQTVTVSVNGDITSEPNETFFMNLTGATNATIVDGQGLGTIINDDLVIAPTPSVSISDFAVVEGNTGTTNAVFNVTLSAVSAQTVTVVVTSADGTANASGDYVALPPTTLTFLPGETTKTVTVAVNGDVTTEPNEVFFVNLTGATNATIADGQALGTIIDDDLVPPPAPQLSISDVAVSEGNSGLTNAVFTVTLSAVSGQTVTVVATSANNTATASSDYIALPPTTLTFLPGETTKTITVAVNGDSLVEGDESFFVNLTGATNATITDGQGIATIINDDSVSASTVSLSKINDGAETSTPSNGKFRVTLSAVSTSDTVIQYLVTGTATPGAGNDYTALTGTVTIPAGQLTADINVNVLNDAVVEDTETVTVTLSGLGAHDPAISLSAIPANLTATVNITDDDPVVITSGDTATVVSNTSAATVILDVNAAPVAGHTLSYGLSGPDAALFSINSSTGEIRFLVAPNFAVPADQGANNVYNVTVTVTGDFTPPRSTSQALTITVTSSVGSEPVFVDASPTFSIPENTAVGTVVGAVSATDADLPAQTLTYSIVSGNASGAFAINTTTGQITVANSTPLNFEVTPSFTLSVQVSDNSSPTPRTATAVVVVNLTNVGLLITIPDPQSTYQIGNRTPALIAPDSILTLDDAGTPNFSNAKLTVSIVGGPTKGDQLKIVKKGSGANAIVLKGRKVFAGGVLIGTYVSGGTSRQPSLVVTFNSSATVESVNNVLRSVNFKAKSGGGTTRTLQVQLTNAGGLNSNIASHNIVVLSK